MNAGCQECKRRELIARVYRDDCKEGVSERIRAKRRRAERIRRKREDEEE